MGKRSSEEVERVSRRVQELASSWGTEVSGKYTNEEVRLACILLLSSIVSEYEMESRLSFDLSVVEDVLRMAEGIDLVGSVEDAFRAAEELMRGGVSESDEQGI